MQFVLLLIVAYFSGSIPFGKLIAGHYGVDIQKRGSGNIGFANVRRVLGWRVGIVTLLCDIAKGALPALLAVVWLNDAAVFWVGLVAIIGHIFPVWLRFKGGKGIATGLGMLFIWQPIPALIGVSVYLVGCLIVRNSALSSMSGVITVAIAGCALNPELWWQFGVLVLLALWTLRKNIVGTVPDYDI